MFVPGQTSSSPLLEVASAIGAIKTGSYEVTNVVAATAGTAVGSSVPTAFDSPVVIDASNKSFTATVDGRTPQQLKDQKSDAWGKSVSVRVDLGGGRCLTKKKKKT